MKHIVIIEINQEEKDFATMSEQEKIKIINELNRRACTSIGYREVPEEIIAE